MDALFSIQWMQKWWAWMWFWGSCCFAVSSLLSHQGKAGPKSIRGLLVPPPLKAAAHVVIPDCVQSLCSTNPQGTRMPPSPLCPCIPLHGWDLSPSPRSLRGTPARSTMQPNASDRSALRHPLVFCLHNSSRASPQEKAYSPLTLGVWNLCFVELGSHPPPE